MDWIRSAKHFELGLGVERVGERIVVVEFPNGGGIERHAGYMVSEGDRFGRRRAFHLRESKLHPLLFEAFRSIKPCIRIVTSDNELGDYNPTSYELQNFDFLAFYANLRGNETDIISPLLGDNVPGPRGSAYVRTAS